MPYTVQDYLVEQSPIIGTDINQKLMEQPTPWITLYKQEFWDDEKSNSQKTFQFDRAMIVSDADEVEWADVSSDITPSDATSNHQTSTADGIPPSDSIEFGQTLRSYNLKHKAIWGPSMNTNQLRDKFERVKQMGACVKALADQSRETWIDRKRREYTRISNQLVVLDSGFTLANDFYGKMAFPAATGTDSSILSNGFTDSIYEYMNLHGAGKGAMGMAEGRPVYGLVTSSRQSRRLIMADPDVREDFRYSSQNEKLLAPMGVKWNYNGFTHIIDDKTLRWEKYVGAASGGNGTQQVTDVTSGVMTITAALTGMTLSKGSTIIPSSGETLVVTGRVTANTFNVVTDTGAVPANNTNDRYFTAWVNIPQYYIVGSGPTRKRVPNPSWLNATWEDSYVFHQDVCCSLVPKPITSVGQASFDAVNYSGTFRWTNYDDKTDNPDKTIGQFRGVLSNGTRPDNPEFGVVIRHLAVPNPDGRIIGASSLG